MPFAFPSSPTVGQQSTQNGRIYQWNGSAWTLVADSATAPFVPLAGGTMTGALAVSAGTASAPGLAVAGNTNTGLAQVGGTGTISVIAGGVEACRATSSQQLILPGPTATTTKTGRLVTNGYICRAGSTASTAFGVNDFNIWWTNTVAQLYIDNVLIGTFAYTSDYRVKANVQPLPSNAIGVVQSLRPITYQFTTHPDLPMFSADGVTRCGFLAHELAEAIPSAVDGEKDAPNRVQSLRLDALCAVMVKAMQEQQAQISALEQRLATLEARVP